MKTTPKSARRWFWWHKWTSLICTIFLLLLCITGLPLTFHHEIDEWTAAHTEVKPPVSESEKPSITEIIDNGLTAYPQKVLRYVIWEPEEPGVVYLSLSDSLDAAPDNFKILRMSAATGTEVGQFKQEGFMYTMLRLHTDLK